MNELLYDIIFCRKDTFSDRIKLLKPAFLSVNISFLIYLFINLEYKLISPIALISIIIVCDISFLLSLYLSRSIKHNMVLFLPSVFLFISSLYLLFYTNGQSWLFFQILSLIVINFIGSTRCNVINFILLLSTSLIASLVGAELDQNIMLSQLPIFMIFPLVLYNSFYKTKLNIDHINDLSNLHKKEFEILEKETLAEIAYNTSIVAHEVNNALTVLNANIFILQRKLPEEKELTSKVLHSSERIKNIVQLIKKKSYISSERETFNFSKLLQDDIELMKLSLRKFNITINVEQFDVDVILFGNQTECSQILSNLVSNARDALNDKDIVDKKISIALKKESKQAKLVVSDNAGGIPPEIIDHIFDKSFTTKERGSGTGLGLYYIHQVIDKMGGEISVACEHGKTTFTVIFSLETKTPSNPDPVSEIPQALG